MSYTYEYAMPSVTADIIVFKWSKEYHLQVLTIERKGNPYKGMLALPGGYMEMDETTKEAVVRETLEETSLDISMRKLSLVGHFDKPGRDPRGRTISFCYAISITDEEAKTIKAGDDATSFSWVKVDSILEDITRLAFDHKLMIVKARELMYGGW